MKIHTSLKKLHPLTDIDMKLFCIENKIPLIDIYLRDEEIPIIKAIDSAYIINIDSSKSIHNGTHWVGFIVKNYKCYYFDSYGYPPPREIIAWFKNKNPHNLFIQRNNIEIQESGTITCGYYVLKFMFDMLIKDKTFYNFIYKYVTNSKSEALIKKQFKIK